MISTGMWTGLTCILYGLVVYAWLDTGSEVYADIIASLTSIGLSWYLALQLLGENVANIYTAYNSTSDTMLVHTVTLQAPGLAYILVFTGVVMLFYLLYSVLSILQAGGG